VPNTVPTCLTVLMFCLLRASAQDLPPVGRFDHKPLTESSGIVKSLRYPGVWWTHNDSGNAPTLFATTLKGKLIREVPLPSASNLDWEDLALDERGNLWVGDIGDNLKWRSSLTLYRVADPDPRSRVTARATPFVFQYPDSPHDAETLLAREGHLFVVNKVPPPEVTTVYVADPAVRTPLSPGVPGQSLPAPLSRVTSLKFAFPITGGDVSRDGKRLALTGCDGLYVFVGDGKVEDLLRQQPHLLWHKGSRQVEAAGSDGYDVYPRRLRTHRSPGATSALSGRIPSVLRLLHACRGSSANFHFGVFPTFAGIVLTNEQRQLFRVSAAAYENAPQVNVSP